MTDERRRSIANLRAYAEWERGCVLRAIAVDDAKTVRIHTFSMRMFTAYADALEIEPDGIAPPEET